MIFAHFLLQVNEANSFVVGCEESGEALLVDAAEWDSRIPAFLKHHGLRLTTVVITHNHFDHCQGLRSVLDAAGCTAHSGAGQAGGCSTEALCHDDALRVGQLEARVIATPGHTPDGISLYLPGMVFTGDALFAGSVGGTTSHGNQARQLEAIRNHIFTLPAETQVHCGHGPSSTVGIEKQYNPFFS